MAEGTQPVLADQSVKIGTKKEETKHRMDCGINHCNIEHTFPTEHIAGVDRLYNFNPKFLKDIITLKFFIRSVLEYDGDIEEYNKAIDEAIKTDNLDALECLRQGIYRIDKLTRFKPAYDDYLILAVSGSSLKTIQHCFYAFQNYPTRNGFFAMSRQALLITCAHHNHNQDSESSRRYIMTLPHYIMACGRVAQSE